MAWPFFSALCWVSLSFADVAVSEDFGSLVKVNVIRGNLAMADLRGLSKLRNPWIPLTETNPAKILSYDRQESGCLVEGSRNIEFIGGGRGEEVHKEFY